MNPGVQQGHGLENGPAVYSSFFPTHSSSWGRFHFLSMLWQQELGHPRASWGAGRPAPNTWIFIGYKFLSRADFCLISVHFFFRFLRFKTKMTIPVLLRTTKRAKLAQSTSRKKLTLHFFVFQSCWVWPGISALFPGISAQKNRHILAQRRVRSARKVRNTKLTTLVKKRPFPGPSKEIRPKGRNLANG